MANQQYEGHLHESVCGFDIQSTGQSDGTDFGEMPPPKLLNVMEKIFKNKTANEEAKLEVPEGGCGERRCDVGSMH
jgi:hypothetical protein